MRDGVGEAGVQTAHRDGAGELRGDGGRRDRDGGPCDGVDRRRPWRGVDGHTAHRQVGVVVAVVLEGGSAGDAWLAGARVIRHVGGGGAGRAVLLLVDTVFAALRIEGGVADQAIEHAVAAAKHRALLRVPVKADARLRHM